MRTDAPETVALATLIELMDAGNWLAELVVRPHVDADGVKSAVVQWERVLFKAGREALRNLDRPGPEEDRIWRICSGCGAQEPGTHPAGWIMEPVREPVGPSFQLMVVGERAFCVACQPPKPLSRRFTE
ncbi:MAG: hypothetical protein FWD04_09760 [Conexibacteraceae bacterium]|nr:hypothetical protein [Conexibacteraceae bacterium]